jgi:hypothetical protein
MTKKRGYQLDYLSVLDKFYSHQMFQFYILKEVLKP